MSKIKQPLVPGLYVREGKRGHTWNFYRYGLPRASLGPCSLYTLEEANEWAREQNGLPRTKWSLKEVCERITTKAKQKGNRNPSYIHRNLKRAAPDWLAKDIKEITRQMVNARHDRLIEANGPVAAHQFVVSLRTVYNFANNQLDVEARNPAKGIETIPAQPRQRVLTAQEMVAFLAAAKAEGEYWHSYFVVLAETGMRKTNVCTMEWRELDGDVWTIPASKFKTKNPHSVQLTPIAQAALAARRLECPDHPYVWPSYSGKALQHLSRPDDRFCQIRKAAGGGNYTMHDFRRTLGSRLANAGVNLQVVAAVLGHKTITTTMKHYTVVSADAVKKALAQLGT